MAAKSFFELFFNQRVFLSVRKTKSSSRRFTLRTQTLRLIEIVNRNQVFVNILGRTSPIIPTENQAQN